MFKTMIRVCACGATTTLGCTEAAGGEAPGVPQAAGPRVREGGPGRRELLRQRVVGRSQEEGGRQQGGAHEGGGGERQQGKGSTGLA